MSDLCAPLYVVCGTDEALTFWCFVSVMNRMVSPVVYSHQLSADLPDSENQLSSGSKRDENAAVNAATTSSSDGPRAVSSFREDRCP